MLLKITLAAITLCSVFTTLASKRTFNVEIHNMTCTPFDPSVRSLDCEYKKMPGISRYAFNISVVMNRQLPRTTHTQVLVYLELPNNSKKKAVKFLDIKFKTCDSLRVIEAMPLFRDFLHDMLRSSNLPLKCPIKANHRYYVQNLIVSDETFPSYTPILKYNLSAIFTDKKRKFSEVHVWGSTVPKE